MKDFDFIEPAYRPSRESWRNARSDGAKLRAVKLATWIIAAGCLVLIALALYRTAVNPDALPGSNWLIPPQIVPSQR